MNEEQLQRSIEFLTQSQTDSAVRNAVIEENFQKLQGKLESLSETVRNLVLLGRDLVTVAEMHSRRRDRIDGIQS